MTQIYAGISAGRRTILGGFERVYLFGSALQSATYDDIDLLLVYENGKDLNVVSAEVRKVLQELSSDFDQTRIDAIVFSQEELGDTDFLKKIGDYVEVI